MEHVYLPLFLVNIFLILLATSLGYHLLPRLLAARDAAETGRTATGGRGVLSLAVALYMFFNCLGYFQRQMSWLVTVAILALVDIGLQLWVRHRHAAPPDDGDDRDGLP